MKKINKRISVVLVITMLLTFAPFTSIASAEDYSDKVGVTVTPLDSDVITADLTLDREIEKMYSNEESYSDDDIVRAIIVLNEKPVIEYEKSTSMLTTSYSAKNAIRRIGNEQESVQAVIEREVLDGRSLDVEYKYSYTLNGIAASLTYGELKEVRKLIDVKYAVISAQYHLYPMTADSSKMVGAQETWAAGYDGTGMRIAVIDSGIDINHPSFAGSGVVLEDSDEYLTKTEIQHAVDAHLLNGLNQASLGGEPIGSSVLFRSNKIAFGWNYVDRNKDITHSTLMPTQQPNSHGSHVAGIAAANKIDTTDVVGIAPKAQLLIMRVFGINGGAFTSDIIAAIEDSLVLNADVINLSLGSDAGFTSDDKVMEDVLAKASQTDVVLCMAAGNNTSSSYGNIRMTDAPLTSNPDNGVVGSPSTFTNGFSVASLDNSVIFSKYIQAGNVKIAIIDSQSPLLSIMKIADTAIKYVVIGDPKTGEGIYGLEGDFPKGDFSNAVAVVSRGESTFAEKHRLAAEAGFAGLIIYNNRIGTFGANVEDSGKNIAVATVTATGGAQMISKAVYDEGIGAYVGDLSISKTSDKFPSETAWKVSDFSSCGTTPDLRIKPEISGVGGNIYSTVDGGKYAVMGGTSMASPQVAGMTALVLEYLSSKYPDMKEVDRRVIAQSLLMSTAFIVMSDEEAELPYSPRNQGAGLGNVLNAVTSKAYLSVKGSEKPKVELGDDNAKNGIYSFSFDVNNLEKEPLNYKLKTYTLSEDHFIGPEDGLEYMAQSPIALNPQIKYTVRTTPTDMSLDFSGDKIVDTNDVWMLYKAIETNTAGDSKWLVADFNEDQVINNKDLEAFLETVNRSADYQMFEGDGTQITVPSGKATVDVIITLSAEDKAYMDSNFENGIYVDGFVKLEAIGDSQDLAVTDLSLPFLAFYGDWTKAPMFDNAYAADLDSYVEREMLYPNIVWTGDTMLGLNPYVLDDEYIPERSNVISPDGSSKIITDYYLSLLRGARNINTTISKDNGDVIWQDDIFYARKSAYSQSDGVILPMSWSNEHYGEAIGFWPNVNVDTDDGDRLTLKITGELDFKDVSQQNNDLNEWIMPIRIDETKPTLDENSVDLIYKPLEGENGTKTLSFKVQDDEYVAAVLVLNSSKTKVIGSYAINQTVPSTETEITIDVSEVRTKCIIAVCDYGSNVSYYDIDFNIAGGSEFDNTKLFGYRLGSPNLDPLAWVNFDTEDYTKPAIVSNDTAILGQYFAAEYYDNNVYAIDKNNNFYALPFEKLGSSRTKIASFNFSVGDMTYDYSSDVLLGLADSGADSSNKYMSVIVLDNKDYIPDKDYEVAFKIARPANRPDKDQPLYLLTLACTTEGELYGIGSNVPMVDANGKPILEPSTGKQKLKSGELYYLGKYSDIKNNLGQTVNAEFVMDTGYNPNAAQSMTYDHNTGKLYWAKSGGTTLNFAGNMVEINLKTGEITDLGKTDAEITGLFVPYNNSTSSDPVNKINIEQGEKLNLIKGAETDLTVQVVPWTANKEIVWSSSNDDIATVNENGHVVAVGNVTSGSAIITAAAKTNPLITDTIEIIVKDYAAVVGGYAVSKDAYGEVTLHGWTEFSTDGITRLESGENRPAIVAGTRVGDELHGFSIVDKEVFPAQVRIEQYNMSGGKTTASAIEASLYVDAKNNQLTDVTYNRKNGTYLMSFGKSIYIMKGSTAMGTDFTSSIGSNAKSFVGLTLLPNGFLYAIDDIGNLYKITLNSAGTGFIEISKIAATKVGNTTFGGVLMNSMCYNEDNGMLYFAQSQSTGASTMGIKFYAINPTTGDTYLLGKSNDIVSFGSIYIK